MKANYPAVHPGRRSAQDDPHGSDPGLLLPDEEEGLDPRQVHRRSAGPGPGRRIPRHLLIIAT